MIFGKNLNWGLIGKEALFGTFSVKICHYFMFFQIFWCKSVKHTVTDHFMIFTPTIAKVMKRGGSKSKGVVFWKNIFGENQKIVG